MTQRSLCLPALALWLLGCSGPGGGAGAGASTPSGPSKMESTLEIKLIAAPARLALADRASFQIGIEAKNRGAAPVDPKLHEAVLTANGARVYAWDLAIQNGIHDASWTALPPGQTISASWALGDALFERPGTYELVLAHGGQRSAARVEVTP